MGREFFERLEELEDVDIVELRNFAKDGGPRGGETIGLGYFL